MREKGMRGGVKNNKFTKFDFSCTSKWVGVYSLLSIVYRMDEASIIYFLRNKMKEQRKERAVKHAHT